MNLDTLNPAQREAVEKTEGPVLILAGAGSGKTRVLTTRIAHLMEDKNVQAANILAITFTNKAATEMRERRVLTTRIAHLMEDKNVQAANILAITFTNKAATEMRERVEETITELDTKDMWITTFHSCCVRILRKGINRIGYNRSFVIYDSSDQVTLIKDCLKELNLSDKVFEPKSVISAISGAKDKLQSPAQFKALYQSDVRMSKIADIYALYQDRLKRNSALDFDDLIYKTVELFKEDPETLEFYRSRFKYIMVDEYQDTSKAQYELIKMLARQHQNTVELFKEDPETLEFYRSRFKYIMVDEYQDTSKAQYELIKMLARQHQNICVVGEEDPETLEFYRSRFKYIMVDEYQDTSKAQYELIKMLARQHQNICVVGDDDQSIYGWRGADIRNILEFEKDYDNVHVVKLEQNYRSTQIILDAANTRAKL